MEQNKTTYTLRKFCPINKWTLANLNQKKIHLSKVDRFNDPNEYVYKNGFLKHWKEKHKDENEKKLSDIINIIENAWIGCFSIIELEYYEEEKRLKEKKRVLEEKENFLMWSHYGDSHKGIALDFEWEVDNNFDNTEEKMKFLYDEIKYADDVLYQKYQDRGIIDQGDFISTIKDIFFYKDNCFKHEKEFRILNTKIENDDEKFNTIDISNKLKQVTLGWSCSDVIQDLIRAIIKENWVEEKITISYQEQGNSI